MKTDRNLLIEILSNSIKSGPSEKTYHLSKDDASTLFKAAWIHSILPLVADKLRRSGMSLPFYEVCARRIVTVQAAKSSRIPSLAHIYAGKRAFPCRGERDHSPGTVSKPGAKPSADEDLLIRQEEFPLYHRALLEYGLLPVDPDIDINSTYEISYEDKDRNLYIEIHRQLFPPDSKAYGNLNGLFAGVEDRSICVMAYGKEIKTLVPSDHLLYLICHAYKHFLHSGVGIRQVADIALFSNHYKEDINWGNIYDSCQSVHIEVFAAALFQIAHKYLVLQEIPSVFAMIETDEEPLLQDILSGGLYGTADIDRVHSSNITLNAVEANRQGHMPSGLLHSLFPGSEYLKKNYPYAQKYPFLLPVAYINRIFYYFRQGDSMSGPVRTLQIGQERIDLLKQYRILR